MVAALTHVPRGRKWPKSYSTLASDTGGVQKRCAIRLRDAHLDFHPRNEFLSILRIMT